MAGDAKTYDDRGLTEPSETALPKPQIDIIVDGNKIFKPGMKTYFVDDYGESAEDYQGQIMGEYCTCDTVTTVYTVCTCEHVCTCESVCSCVGFSSNICTANIASPSPGTTICTCQAVSCGAPCACVPVT